MKTTEKDRTNLILVLAGIVITGIVIMLINRVKRWNRMRYVAKFIENPEKLIEGADLDAMNPKLLKVIQQLSRKQGSKIHVNSGFRTVAKNTAVGGAGHSAHLDGDAADLAAENPIMMAYAAWQLGIRRIGVGARYIHIDVSDHLPSPAIWVYAGSAYTKSEAESIIKGE